MLRLHRSKKLLPNCLTCRVYSAIFSLWASDKRPSPKPKEQKQMIQVYAVMGIGRRRQVTSQVMGSYGDITKALQGIASWESLEKIASPNHPYDVYSFASELPALAKARKANEQSWASVHESDVFMTAADELALVL